MARTATLTQLLSRTRFLSNTTGATTAYPDATLTVLINNAICEVYDLLVEASPPDYYLSKTTPAQVTTSTTYWITWPTDFRTLVNVYEVESTSGLQRRLIRPLNDEEASSVGTYAPVGAWYVLEYVPAPTLLSAAGDTFDGVSGWEELVCAYAARDIREQQQRDISSLQLKIDRLEARIRANSKRDMGHSWSVSNVYATQRYQFPSASNDLISGYQAQGSGIKLYGFTRGA
jgi:hypothetical protein